MTTEDWKKAEALATSLYTSAQLLVDGYRVSLQLMRINPYKCKIMVYVDGHFEGRWTTEDCEERRRFMYEREHSLMNHKQIQDFNKLPKKSQKYLQEYRDKKFSTYSPQFPSFSALKRHLTAHNENIQLLPERE